MKGKLQVETHRGSQGLAGEAIVIHAGEWVCYSTPAGSREETISGLAKAMS